MKRVRGLAAAAALCFAGTTAVADTPPPATLLPYVHGAQFSPGDYGWLKGAFSDATPAEKLRWQATRAWSRRCLAADRAVVQGQAERAGIPTPNVSPDAFFGDALCTEVMLATPSLAPTMTFAEFMRIRPDAELVAITIVWTAQLAFNAARVGAESIPGELSSRTLRDQILRSALMLDSREQRALAKLSPDQIAIVRSLVWLEIDRTDRDNTAWLKRTVAQHGWIDAARYGAEASSNAWLLVQHADRDPIFQYNVLQGMHPSGDAGVTPEQYALLWDRVGIHLRQTQRYGSQLMCRDHKWVPFTIEDQTSVDQRRAAVGLQKLPDYVRRLTVETGPC